MGFARCVTGYGQVMGFARCVTGYGQVMGFARCVTGYGVRSWRIRLWGLFLVCRVTASESKEWVGWRTENAVGFGVKGLGFMV
jgi:hypothetical protein